MQQKLYLINVGPQGTFKPSGNYQTTPEDIDAMFDYLDAEKKQRICLFFHGGLVSESRGIETADKMAKHIEETGNHPICFAWETGFLETVSTNLKNISSLSLFDALKKILLKKVSKRLGVDPRGKGTSKELTFKEIEEELLKDNPFETIEYNTVATAKGGSDILTNSIPPDNTLQADLEAEIEEELELNLTLQKEIANNSVIINQHGVESKGIISLATFIKSAASIGVKVIKRFINKRDHGLYPTIIEEIMRELYMADLGAWVWGNMKNKALEMWQDNRNRTGINQYVGNYFLNKLLLYKQAYPNIEINIIGHSAGTIVTCHMINKIVESFKELKFKNILFLAPAVRIELFEDSLIKHKEIYSLFRIFTMYDEIEKRDHLVPYLYTRSLLYLISGILEDKGDSYDALILGLERHLCNEDPYNTIPSVGNTFNFLYNQNPNKLVFSVSQNTALDGFICQATKHGYFDDDIDYTIKSLKHILSN